MTAAAAEASLEEAPRLPSPGLLFAAREARFRALAPGNAAEELLLLLARVAAGQRAAAALGAPSLPPPDGAGPPLAALRARPDAGWRAALSEIVAAAREAAPPAETVAALGRLGRADAAELDALAAAALGGGLAPADLACAPFVGAALQARLTSAAGALPRPPAGDAGASCPACGAPPVASVVEGVSRRRFLHCALCATAWHVPRLSCVACREDGGLVYLHAEDVPGVKAEACERCGAYLKLLDEERRPGADAAADDAATLALDLRRRPAGIPPARRERLPGRGARRAHLSPGGAPARRVLKPPGAGASVPAPPLTGAPTMSFKTLLLPAAAALALGAASPAAAQQHGGHDSMHSAQPAKGAIAEGTLKDGVRVFEMAVTEEGFEPSRVKIKKGEKVRFLVTRKTDRTCATEIVIKEHGIEQKLPLDKTVTVEFTPTKSGEVRYACGMGHVSGVLFVP